MRALLLAAVLAACGADPVDPPLPDPPDAAPPVTCGELQVAFARELSRVSRFCSDDVDCIVVGGAGRCGCVPHVGKCQGEAVSGAAYTASPASAYGAQFVQQCSNPLLCDSNLTCGCDCAQLRSTCINNRCQAIPSETCP